MKKVIKGYNLFLGVLNYHLVSRFKPLMPTRAQINVTYRCNSRCQFCHIWAMQPKNEMALAEWAKVTGDPLFRQLNEIMIAGGEPFLHPQLTKLVTIFLKNMPNLQSVSLTTNGFLTEQITQTVKELLKVLNRRKVDLSISVSLDGLAEIHDGLRQTPGAFRRASATILALKELQKRNHFGLGVSGVICRKNLDSLEKVPQWCETEGVNFSYQIIGFHENYVNNLEQKHSLDFTQENKKDLFRFLKKIIQERSWRNPKTYLRSYYWADMLSLYKGRRRTTPCPFVKDAFVLGSLGDLYYCLSEASIGNCRRGETASSLYFSKTNLARRRQMAKTVCLHCNSGCMVSSAIAKEFKKWLYFYLTGKLGPVGVD